MQLLLKSRGLIIALTIIITWFFSLLFLLNFEINFQSPLPYLFLLLQTHLYTGLFITAHDAMHGVVNKNKQINRLIGQISAILFAYNFYNRLLPKHHLHHKHVATEKDPDFFKGNLFTWYYNFLKQYINIWQIALMAITYNILILYYSQENVILFWIVPSLLATFQLFYFGTYLPHKGQHTAENKHKSGSLSKNHLIAFITCYFFGYHYEHHDAPWVPWWQLYKEKKE